MLRRVVASSFVIQLALGLAYVASPDNAPGVAWAEPTFDGQGVLDLLQATGIVGDGTSTVDMYVLALTPDGLPMVGLKGKPSASSGTTTELTELTGGLYKFTFSPARTDAVQTVTLTFKSKLASKEQVTRTWNVSVAPPVSHQLSVSINPASITLGQDKTASVSFNLAGGDRQALAGVDLRTNLTAGTIENVTNLGAGQFSALFNTPNVGYPHMLLLTAVDKRDPGRTYGSAAVPLVGKAEFPVQALPNSRVMIKVAGREFGPIQTDAQGRAKVPIVVPPGASAATKTQIAPDGKVTEEPLDLKIPESRRVALFPTATAVPSDGRVSVPIRTLVVTPDGKPDESALVVIQATAGTMSPAKHEGGGVYMATFTPPTSNANTQVTLTVGLSNGSSVQSDSTTLNLVPVRPAKVTLSAEPSILSSTADGFKVFAKVTSADGQGLGSRAVAFNVNGGKLKDVKDLKNGDYQANFQTTGTGPVELTAAVATAATGNPFARVLLIPSRDRVPNDGMTPLLFTLATVDEYGYPVGNVVVNLKMLSGDGSIPQAATTSADGTAQIYYTAGRKAQTVSLEASANDATAAVSVMQVPGALVLPELPTVGPKAVASMIDEWSATISPLRLEREGMTGAVLTATSLPAVAGDKPTKLAISSDPASVSPGGTVVLKIQLLNGEGRGVGGAPIEFLTSTGTVGPINDLGNGNYQATLSVPASTTGEVKVSVATKDGLLSQFMRIPVGGAEAAWSGANPFAAGANPYAQQTGTAPVPPVAVTPTPVADVKPVKAPKPVKEPKPKAPDGEFPWLRASAGYAFSSYAYSQQPVDTSTGPFVNSRGNAQPIELASLTHGFSVGGKVWLPMVKYLGADVALSSSRYGLDPSGLCAALGKPCADSSTVSDWVTDFSAVVVGRYPFEAGANQFWVGGRVGFDTTDVQAIQSKKASVDLTQIGVNSLAVGAELGANIGPKVFIQTDFTEYLAGGSAPFDSTFNVAGGYAIIDHLYVGLAFDMALRSIDILSSDGVKIGEVSDSQFGGTASIGIQY